MHIQCTICNDLVNQADNIHVTICGHIFHYLCISKWIERSQSCPQCRNKVTEKCMFRLYPTICDEAAGDDAAIQRQGLDEVLLQLGHAIKTHTEKMASMEDEMMKNINEWGIEGTLLKIFLCVMQCEPRITVELLLERGPVLAGLRRRIKARCFTSILRLQTHGYIKITKDPETSAIQHIELGPRILNCDS